MPSPVRIARAAVRERRSWFRQRLLCSAALLATFSAGCTGTPRMVQNHEADPFLANAPQVASATETATPTDPFAVPPSSSTLRTGPGTAHVSDRNPVPPTFAAMPPQRSPSATAVVTTTPSPVPPAAQWWNEPFPEPATGVATAGFVCDVDPSHDAPTAADWHPTRHEQTAAKPFPLQPR